MPNISKKYLISIIIPVYNKSEELRQCLESVLKQVYKNYEVIIVNDGSIDNSSQLIDEINKKFLKSGIRSKVIQQNNQGSNAARNRGFIECRGGFVIFWDADVVAAPDMLDKMYDALQNHPEVSYAYCSFAYGKKKFKLWEFNADKLRQMPYIHTTSLCHREHFPGWDEDIQRLQDWDIWLTMLEQGHTGVWIPEFLFTVLTKHGTISSWLPKFAYKLMPWLNSVKRYQEASEVIKHKHKIIDNK